MRQIILDTETSGLDYDKDRIIEIGCLELVNGIYTGEKFHKYYKPDNLIISSQSEQIHGLNNKFLSNFKTFDEEIDSFLSFINKSQLIIHNAQFDLTMINNSLKRLSKEIIKKNETICTLEMAKKKFPGSKNNLNALCRRFDISLESRKTHGALTDSFLLLEVFNELTGGKQNILKLNVKNLENNEVIKKINAEELPRVNLSEKEESNHSKMLKKIEKHIWYN
jgi:DNA polymerase-3 subunit epsilon